ncbi:MAG: peptidoglycan-binding protein [Clostridiales bacterium]|nr:peptidoglycan-binding protein [Clostridiales bacterium]
MDILKTVLLYLSMLYISSVQVAPDPATVNITPSPAPTAYGIYATTELSTPTPTPVPTPAITANPAYGQLVMGDRNATVKDVQLRLQELGYYTGTIDSAYGNQTRRAVEQFQYQNGLTVDGIAGKYTQTILFESPDVVAAPVVTNTPAFYPDETDTPPPPTAVTSATPMPSPAPTQAPEPTATPDVNAPMLMEPYSFVMYGFTQPLTVQDTETLLHPVESEETLYIPLTEILKNAGNVVIESSDGSLEEIAFSVLTDFYQVSYTVNGDGSVSNLVFEKNTQPQPLVTRSAVLLDGVCYLPLEDMQRITGITFATDDMGGVITVTMPSAGT